MDMDEFPGIVAKPISHNPYAYVHNDQINNVGLLMMIQNIVTQHTSADC